VFKARGSDLEAHFEAIAITGVPKRFVSRMVLSIHIKWELLYREVAYPLQLIHRATDAANSSIANDIRGTIVKWHCGLEIKDSRTDPRAGIEYNESSGVTA
jgi:hypothetical protein